MGLPITITPISGTVTVAVGSTVLGASTQALELREAGHQPVVYVPRDDIDMSRLLRTDHTTKCPWKGQASYYSIKGKVGMLANAVWTYEDPLPEVSAIAGFLAFYPDRVTVTRG